MTLNSSDIATIVNGRLSGPSDLPVSDMVTDSRQLIFTEGLLFFAISGKNHDGHTFIDSLYQKGIRIFVIERGRELLSRYSVMLHFIIVRSSIEALQMLGCL